MNSTATPPLADTAPETVPMSGEELARLKRDSVRGGLVNVGAQGAAVLIQLVSTVVLARLLSPQEYGIVAMVLAVTAFAGLFRDMGLSSATIQAKQLSPAQQSNLFWLNVAMGLALTLIVASLSPVVAWVYREPAVRGVTLAMSLSFVIGSFGAQPAAMLVRQMGFGRKAVATLAGSLTTLAVAVTLAFQGWSYWSLVWGNLAGAAVSTALLLSLSPFRVSAPSLGQGMRGLVGFGAHVTAFDLVNYFHRNLDNLLIGAVWGAGALGYYSRAYALVLFPINAIRGPIQTVAFPTMSRLRDEPESYRLYYRKVLQVVALGTMPVMAFSFITADSLLCVLLGERWASAVPVFKCLAVVAFVQPVSGLRGLLLLSRGESRRYFLQGAFAAACNSLAFLCGLPWGPTGVAVAYCLSVWLLVYPTHVYSCRGSSVSPADFFRETVPVAVLAVCAAVVAYAVMRIVAAEWAVADLVVAATAYALSAVAAVIFIPAFRPYRNQLYAAWGTMLRSIVPANATPSFHKGRR